MAATRDGHKRGRGPTTTQACGTYPGYMRHWRRGERGCQACLVALAQYESDRRLAPQRRALLDAEVEIGRAHV